ncbi:hypothetical protein K439DRAFT_1620698 [Ramaria rubella]|nr:hypothetical protein K439DRAFT_1620698 [Ramaria rubella]
MLVMTYHALWSSMSVPLAGGGDLACAMDVGSGIDVECGIAGRGRCSESDGVDIVLCFARIGSWVCGGALGLGLIVACVEGHPLSAGGSILDVWVAVANIMDMPLALGEFTSVGLDWALWGHSSHMEPVSCGWVPTTVGVLCSGFGFVVEWYGQCSCIFGIHGGHVAGPAVVCRFLHCLASHGSVGLHVVGARVCLSTIVIAGLHWHALVTVHYFNAAWFHVSLHLSLLWSDSDVHFHLLYLGLKLFSLLVLGLLISLCKLDFSF